MQRYLEDQVLLYLHVPFCPTKCHFCFKVHRTPRHVLLDEDLHDEFVSAARRDIRTGGAAQRESRFSPVGLNWGGGTPTALSTAQIETLAGAFHDIWNLTGVPFSVEATPDTFTAEIARCLADVGVTRVSLGAQTLNDRTLARMGRSHNREQVARAVSYARAAGIDDVNLDLILALPYDNLADNVASVQAAVEMEPTHITTYLYHPTPHTVLFRQLARNPSLAWNREDALRAVERAAEDLLSAGFTNYEYFHWSRDSGRWHYTSLDFYFGHCGDVVGFGAGSHSFVAPRGSVTAPDLYEYLDQPTARNPGPFDLDYALERSLGCTLGLNYVAMAATFGTTAAAVRDHPLVEQLRRVPGVQRSPSGLTVPPAIYQREHAGGVISRLEEMLGVPDAVRQPLLTLTT